MNSLTVSCFIEKSTKIHGNKYNYSNVVYQNNKINIRILCPKHGVFLQSPRAHLNGQGCPICGREQSAKSKTLTKEQFVDKSVKIHGDKYSYDLVEYKSNRQKVTIVCKKHGYFFQTPHNHLNNSGCRKCFIEKLPSNSETFIYKSKKIHGNKYGYNLVSYINTQTKVNIICKKHGVFQQRPAGHLRGRGCPKCGKTKKLTQNEFVQLAMSKHNNIYNYALTSYVNCKSKVKIICKTHGAFVQNANLHLMGGGCPRCNLSKGEIKIKEYLDKNGFVYKEQVRFDSCVDKLKLPFDFMVENNNNICLIEFHGEQHYRRVNFTRDVHRAKIKFKKTKLHDKIKVEWCKNNDIKLLIIPYWASLEESLSFFLKGKV